MAQVQKYQSGGSTKDTQNIYKINNVTPTQYFTVGNSAYDLQKYKDLVWYNFDRWASNNNYNSSIKDKARKFINEVLEGLSSGNVKFNSDLTITIKDNKNNWDPTSGFNKSGPKLFRWITDDKVDDQRGIPHVTSAYLGEILTSPFMKRYLKPEESNLSDLTGKVFDKLVKRDFNGSWTQYDTNWSKRSSSDKVRMFRDALKDFKDSTDFSIYTQSSLKEIGPKIDEFINYLNNNPALDQKFFDKASELGFYGLEQWMRYQKPEEQQSASNQASQQGGSQQDSNTPSIDSTPENSSGAQPENKRRQSSTRILSLKDVNSLISPQISGLIDSYNNSNEIGFFRESLNAGNYAITGMSIQDIDRKIRRARSYGDTIKLQYANNRNLADSELNKYMKFINRYLMGQRTSYSREQINSLINIILNKAHVNSEFELVSDKSDLFYIRDSYDPQTKTYLAVSVDDDGNGAVLAIPSIFVQSTKFWKDLTDSVNNHLANNLNGADKPRKYLLSEIYNIGLLSYFNNKITKGYLSRFLNQVLSKNNYPLYKSGGILKALDGNQLVARTKQINSQGNYGGKSAQQIISERQSYISQMSQERAARRKERKEANEAAFEESRTPDIIREAEERENYRDQQQAEIRSWDDLQKNLNTHDAWVVGTLLSDLVAFGGSLSGGVFNPVADAATVASMVGTIGTVATDKDMSFLQKLGYGTLGVSLDALSLFPELGAVGKAAKIGAVAKQAVPILSKLIRFGSLGIAGAGALAPLKKLYDGQTLTKEDWTKLAYFAEAMLMGTLAGRASRGGKKYTKPVGTSTKYTIKTKNKTVVVDKATYEKYNGASIKELRKKPADEPLFTTVDGEKIYIKDFQQKSFSHPGGQTHIKGKIDESSKGYELMTPEEVSRSRGFEPVTINGKTYYSLPKNYERIRYRMNSESNQGIFNTRFKNPIKSTIEVPLINKRGNVVTTADGNPIMVRVSREKAKEMSELYERRHASKIKDIEESVSKETPKETPKETEGSNVQKETPPKKQDEKVDKKPEQEVKKDETKDKKPQEQKNEQNDKPSVTRRPSNIDQKVYESIVTNHNNLGRSRAVREKLEALAKQSKNKKVLPKIEKDNAYFFNPTAKSYYKISLKDIKTKEQLSKINRRIKRNKAIKFQGGGITINGSLKSIFDESLKPIFKKALSALPSDITVTPQVPNKKEKWYNTVGKAIYNYTPKHWIANAIGAGITIQDANDTAKLENLAIMPTTESVNNNIIYRPTWAVQNQFETQQQIGRNNSQAYNTLQSGDLRTAYSRIYDNTALNSQLNLQDLKNRASEFQTNIADVTAQAKKNIDDGIAKFNSNNAKVKQGLASMFLNEAKRRTQHKQTWANLAAAWGQEEAQKTKLKTYIAALAQKKDFEVNSDEIRDLRAARDAYSRAYKEFEAQYRNNLGDNQFIQKDFEEAWRNSPQAQALAKNVKDAENAYQLNYYSMLNDAVEPGYNYDFWNRMHRRLGVTGYVDPNSFKQGGSLSYEQRMSLKQQDAMNKLINTDKRERSSVQKELIREYNKNMRLISKRSESLLKAAMGVK